MPPRKDNFWPLALFILFWLSVFVGCEWYICRPTMILSYETVAARTHDAFDGARYRTVWFYHAADNSLDLKLTQQYSDYFAHYFAQSKWYRVSHYSFFTFINYTRYIFSNVLVMLSEDINMYYGEVIRLPWFPHGWPETLSQILRILCISGFYMAKIGTPGLILLVLCKGVWQFKWTYRLIKHLNGCEIIVFVAASIITAIFWVI